MKLSIVQVTVILLTVFIISNNLIFFPTNILSWDIFGYYLYLPCTFIYNDIGILDDTVILNTIEKYNSTTTFYQALQLPEGQYVMKYSMGMSFFYAPFFFIGHLFAKLFNYPQDGFSTPYQYSIFFGSIVYSIIGILFLSKIVSRFFSQWITSIVLICIVFGTNYIIHVTMYGQNAMSHSILFAMYTLIIWLTIRWHETHSIKTMILLGVICGITILSRPTEIVCLIIPALWGLKSRKDILEKITMFWRLKKQIIIFVTILFFFGMLQFSYWKHVTGHWIYYSYGGNAGEGLDLFTPHFADVLISFRKGWLIYTPMMGLAIFGFIQLYKNNRGVFWVCVVFFMFNLYLVSSWSCWWYAQSFSQRALIQSYPIMAIPLGYLLTWVVQQQRIIRISLSSVVVIIIGLNLFQSYQFHKGIIHGDRMTKAYYIKVFGTVNFEQKNDKYLLVKRSFDGVEQLDNPEDYQRKFSKVLNFDKNTNANLAIQHLQTATFQLDSLNIYSPAIEIPYSKLTKKDHAWIRVTVNVYPISEVATNTLSFVTHFLHNEFPYKYSAIDATRFKVKPNQWNKVSYYYLTPEVRNSSDALKVFVRNSGTGTVYLDNLKIDVYEEK
jgi:hypothetical protein